MRINFIFFLSLIYSTTIICQSKQNNQWILGTHQGVVIDFNNEEPTVTNIEKDLLMNATNASICDEDGNLLFYTNGCDIFNKNFEIMENGDSISNQGLLHGLFCNTTGSLQSQAAMIFPRPETKNEYIVVHNDLMSDDFEGKGFLYYSVVDINENDGLGHVTEKDNIIRQDSINFFGISATRHANNIDWWIVFPLSQSNCYVKLLLTKKGVEYQNTQCLGEVWTSRSPQGSTKFSPDGKAYARILYQNGLSVSSFDNATGGFLDPVHINFDPNEEIFFAGVVYSANSR